MTTDTLLSAELAATFAKSVGFSTIVDLTFGSRRMANHTLTASVAFTLGADADAGGRNYVRLTSDGLHVPSFPDFEEHSSSIGWDGRNGALNLIEFWHDGTAAFYRIDGIGLRAVPLYAMRLALVSAGKLHDIIDNIDADVTSEVNIRWTSGAPVKSGDPLSTFIQSTLGYSDGQMTALFTAAKAAI